MDDPWEIMLKLQQFANSPGSGYQKMSSLLFRTCWMRPREAGLRLEIDTVSKWEVNEGSETLFCGLKIDTISKILIPY